jgi:hypothetical protein
MNSSQLARSFPQKRLVVTRQFSAVGGLRKIAQNMCDVIVQGLFGRSPSDWTKMQLAEQALSFQTRYLVRIDT